ncbi:hypothetical protein ABZW03_16405 [Kitasatospora sp. NPDC004799]|uniref:hypothetical protein n=1 Tax=Kitasatospora sp. NPDC004799 TaxID=3154460 RepID=UPI0033B85E3B
MSTAAIPGAPLPVRTPGSRARGRHRRPERPEIPAGAPALVLAVPATAGPESRSVVEELLSIVRTEQNGVQTAVGYLPGNGTDGAGGEERTVAELLALAAEAGRPMPVLVPLVPGPHTFLTELHALAAEYGAPVTDPLGPHPLLAEAVHVRLSEAGLARADRARLFAIATAADGVVLPGRWTGRFRPVGRPSGRPRTHCTSGHGPIPYPANFHCVTVRMQSS